MTHTKSGIAAVFLVLLGSACASFNESDADARATAHAVRQRIVALKSDVRRKIAAEEAYYRDAIATDLQQRERFQRTDVRRTLINRARVTASSLIKDTEQPLEVQLVGGAGELLLLVAANENALRERRQAMETAVAALNALNGKYAALEATLQTLSTPASSMSRVVDIGQFVRNTIESYKALEKEADK